MNFNAVSLVMFSCAVLSSLSACTQANSQAPATSTTETTKCPATAVTSILVDRTVNDKEFLKNTLSKVLNDHALKIWEGGSKYFGTSLKLVYLDDRGESGDNWEITIPKRFGSNKSDFKKALGQLKLSLDKTLAEISNSNIHYKRSLLLEGINNQIKNASACDEVVIISDMYVVDNSGNNFERNIFTTPTPLSSGTSNIVYHRVPVAGQPQSVINKVDSWWSVSLYNKGKFVADLDAVDSKSSEITIESIEMRNEKIIQKTGYSKLQKCLSKGALYDQYAFKITIQGDSGEVSTVKTVAASNTAVGRCLQKQLHSIEYAKVPSKKIYTYLQKIKISKNKHQSS